MFRSAAIKHVFSSTPRIRPGPLATRAAAARTAPSTYRNSTPANRRALSSSNSTRTCPDCSTPLPTALPICTNCSYIARPASLSYHDILGLEYGSNPFRIDSSTLKRKFLEAQRVCHPDTWATKSDEKKALADQISSLINEAYKTLLSPLRRAQYLLRLNGHEASETDALTDQELIMEIMEVREELESAGSQEAVDEIRSRNQERIRETEKEIEELVGRQDWEEVKKAAVKLKYYDGIQEAAKAWPNSAFDH